MKYNNYLKKVHCDINGDDAESLSLSLSTSL